ncbi:MAG: hypothetical protein ACFB20_04450 [Opitutales bacterium]
MRRSATAAACQDLSAILQEIVDRGGWNSGNDLAILIEGTSGKRSARTFERNPAQAAKLIVEYSSP